MIWVVYCLLVFPLQQQKSADVRRPPKRFPTGAAGERRIDNYFSSLVRFLSAASESSESRYTTTRSSRRVAAYGLLVISWENATGYQKGASALQSDSAKAHSRGREGCSDALLVVTSEIGRICVIDSWVRRSYVAACGASQHQRMKLSVCSSA